MIGRFLGIFLRVEILELITSEVAQEPVIVVAGDDVVGRERDLSAAAGAVDDIRRNGITGRVPSQLLHDLDTSRDGRTEMF